MHDASDLPDDSLLDKLGKLYQLDNYHMKIATQSSTCIPADRHTYNMFGQANIMQKISENCASITSFNFNNTVKVFLSAKACLAFLNPMVEAYSTTTNHRGRTIDKSLEMICQDAIEKQPIDWKQTNLAPGHLEQDPTAFNEFSIFLGTQLKQHCGAFRSLIFKNILVTSRISIKGPIPNLTSLIFEVSTNFPPKKEKLLANLIKDKAENNFQVRIRMGHLRLVMAHHLLHEGRQSTSNWDDSDSRIDFLCHQSVHFQQKHAQLILQKDDELFSHNWDFRDIDKSQVTVPSPDHVFSALGITAEDEPAANDEP